MASPFENFSSVCSKEKTLQFEMEKIEITSIKLKEEYKDYEELVGFIDYLRASESIFVISKAQNWNGEKLKEELIKNELHVASMNAGVNEEVFNSIYSDFKTLSGNIGKIYDIVEELLKKYADNQACKEFILYLRDISIIFVETEKEGVGIDEAKDRLFMMRMKSLSSEVKMEIRVFENIYAEFKKRLNK